MKKLAAAFVLLVGVVSVDVARAVDERPTTQDVLDIMSKLPPETCLYNPHGIECSKPGGYDRGPDARRIAAGIALAVDGSVRGDMRKEAALAATFSSYESGNRADARGDCHDAPDGERVCRAKGAFQLWTSDDSMADDPTSAARAWIKMAVDERCAGLDPSEDLAGLAGSCKSRKARRKVRLRTLAAEAALGDP